MNIRFAATLVIVCASIPASGPSESLVPVRAASGSIQRQRTRRSHDVPTRPAEYRVARVYFFSGLGYGGGLRSAAPMAACSRIRDRDRRCSEAGNYLPQPAVPRECVQVQSSLSCDSDGEVSWTLVLCGFHPADDARTLCAEGSEQDRRLRHQSRQFGLRPWPYLPVTNRLG
jgi:hypothetical protein